MADTEAQKKEVESTVEDKVEKKSEDKPVEKAEAKVEENGEAENGDSKDESKEKVEDEKSEKNGDSPATDKCSIKRKSVGSDATDSPKKTEDSTPEKKAKLDESAEAEANGEQKKVAA